MKILNEIASIKVFFALAALLALAFVLGGVVPQGLTPQEYQDLFGRLGGAWVLKFRLGTVFSSPWFLGLIAAAGANLLACTAKQWRTVWQRPGLFLSHLGVLLMFAGGLVHGLFAVKGTLGLRKGQPASEFTDQRGRPQKLPFELVLKEFRITYWDGEKHFIHALRPGADAQSGQAVEELLETVEVSEGQEAHFTSEAADLKIEKFYPDFTIGDKGPYSAGSAPQNPALAVRLLEGRAAAAARPAYLFANHPDFHGVPESNGVRYVYEYRPGRVKQYESRVAALVGGEEKFERTLSVNSPGSFMGYRLYQSGYDAADPDYTGLQVVKDPSVWLIYSGFAILMAGFTWAFRREF